MGKIIRLTESDLTRLVKKVINEQNGGMSSCFKGTGGGFEYIKGAIKNTGDWTITPSPDKNPEYVVVTYKGKGCICKTNEILNLQ
jgi:hypothetical protein